MGQALHARATTTHRIRTEIQQSKESLVKVAKCYGINPKTVAKWRKRSTVEDEPMGKRVIKSTVLTEREEDAIVKCRVLTGLALDDLLIALREEIPKLTRSNLHRCLKRHGVSTLPKRIDKKIPKKEFKDYEIGYFHVDTAEVHLKEGKSYIFVAIDRVSKFVVAKIYPNKTIKSSSDFLHHVIQIVPYTIHTILTDNGTEYSDIAQATPFKRSDILKEKENSSSNLDKGIDFVRYTKMNKKIHSLKPLPLQIYSESSIETKFHEKEHIIESSVSWEKNIDSEKTLEKEVWIKKPSGFHVFDMICKEHGIDHRLTKVKHPWTNGQVERMNRSIKEETVKKYHYKTKEELAKHLGTFIYAYNCAKHLKSLKLKTPLEFLMQKFLKKPILFKRNPHLYYKGPNS